MAMFKVGHPIEQEMPFAVQRGLDGLHENVKGLRPELASSEPLKAVDAASQTPNPDSKCNAPSRHRVFENVSSLECADLRSAKWTRFVPGAIPLDLAVRIEQEVLRCTISKAVLVILLGILCTGLSCYSMQLSAKLRKWDLKSADPYRSWGFKSPSGHHKINNLDRMTDIG
jgi:hypothetical protein